MLGEAVNLHRRWPSAVLGYLFMMSRIDESVAEGKRREKLISTGIAEDLIDATARDEGDKWFKRLGDSVSRASHRASSEDFPERFEVVSCSLVDFSLGPPYPVQYHVSTPAPDEFFDRLVEIHRKRFG